MIEFTTKVDRFEGIGTWTYATVPLDCEMIFNQKSRIKVKATINSTSFKTTLMPHGNGLHFMILNKEIRDKLKVTLGDQIEVKLEADTTSTEIIIPEDFQEVLYTNATANSFFEQLAPSHKKEYLAWISDAKKEETRQRRILQAVEKLKEKVRLK